LNLDREFTKKDDVYERGCSADEKGLHFKPSASAFKPPQFGTSRIKVEVGLVTALNISSAIRGEGVCSKKYNYAYAKLLFSVARMASKFPSHERSIQIL
jgi:hypothetical protein